MRKLSRAVVVAATLIAARASARAEGFQLERYEPPAAGSWFLMLDHPWYSSTRWVAAGLTLDYGHNALLGGAYDPGGTFSRQVAIVEHMLVGHVDVAGSFLDRVQVRASVPVVLHESGTSGFGERPLDGVAISDPRVGALVRLFGHADRDPISLHAGAELWIPVGGGATLAGDPGVRGLAHVIAAGLAVSHLRWSVDAGVLLRGTTSVGFGPASAIGSELQIRAGIGWADSLGRFNVGPEVVVTTPITGSSAFAVDGTGVEVLVGAQWCIARAVMIGAGVGSGVLSTVGTPDARAILRIAYAPFRAARPLDSDADGVPDAEDLCPKVAGSRAAKGCPDEDADGVPDAEDVCPRVAGSRAAKGCADADADGVPDAEDLCPTVPGRATAKGCADADADGVPDAEDLCPTVAGGSIPNARAPGCPAPDADHDGVPDAEDVCPNDAPGERPDPRAKGCPVRDVDHDGVPDAEDLCPNAGPGAHPDAKRKGCPLPDADGDGIPDAEDACPRLAGPASPDPKQSGCPKIEARGGFQTELKFVHFDTNQATLLGESFPVLDEVARLLRQHPELKKVVIAGHADDTGTHKINLHLSKKRAAAVVRYLVKHGVAARRLRAVGYGDTRPLSPDRSDEARARNRRVEMTLPAAPGR